MVRVPVNVQDTIKGQQISWSLETSKKVKHLISDIVRTLGLPQRTITGEVIEYRLYLPLFNNERERLLPNDTLADYRVQPGEVILLTSRRGKETWQDIQALLQQISYDAANRAWDRVADKWRRIHATGASDPHIDQLRQSIIQQGGPSSVFKVGQSSASFPKGVSFAGIAAAVVTILVLVVTTTLVLRTLFGSSSTAASPPTSGGTPTLVFTQLDADNDNGAEPSAEETPTPTITPTPSCPLDLDYVADITIDDGTVLQPGEDFTKIWRVENSGSCEWDTDFEWVHVDGPQLADVDSLTLNDLSLAAVPVGNQVNLDVEMTAPDDPGTYQSVWQMRDADGNLFGERLFIDIRVQCPPINKPVLTNPQDGATITSSQTVNLVWSYPSESDSGCNPESARLFIQSETDITEVKDLPISGSYVFQTEECGRFTWRAFAIADGGEFGQSSTFAFTITCPPG